MTYNTNLNDSFDVPEYAAALNKIIAAKKVQLNTRRNLIKVDPIKKEATFELLNEKAVPNGKTEVQKVIFLHNRKLFLSALRYTFVYF